MKKLIYFILRAYVKLGLGFYFSSYKTFGRENIPKNGAVIFTANHQNAFLDALLIVGNNGRHTHFLARAEVFKKPFFKWLMSLINMMPIYRIRDGWNALNNNEEIFKACFKILGNDDALLIFPEGNHGFERRLRSLSKGFTRIAFGTLHEHPNLKLKIVPVGINYNRHQGFRTKVSIHYGKALEVAPFYSGPDDHNASLKLRDALSEQMKKLIVHIDESEYEEKYADLKRFNPDFSELKETMELIANLKESKESTYSKPGKSLFWYLFRVNYIFPLLIWKWISKKVKDPVMLASIKFSVGIFLFPIFLLIQTLAIQLILGNLMLTAFYFLFSLLIPLAIKSSD